MLPLLWPSWVNQGRRKREKMVECKQTQEKDRGIYVTVTVPLIVTIKGTQALDEKGRRRERQENNSKDP